MRRGERGSYNAEGGGRGERLGIFLNVFKLGKIQLNSTQYKKESPSASQKQNTPGK